MTARQMQVVVHYVYWKVIVGLCVCVCVCVCVVETHQMTIVDDVCDVGQWSSRPAPARWTVWPRALWETSFRVTGLWRGGPVCVCVCVLTVCVLTALLGGGMMSPISVVQSAPLMSPGGLERKGSVCLGALRLRCTVSYHRGQHPGLRLSRKCTYLCLETDNGELTWRENLPLNHTEWWSEIKVTQLAAVTQKWEIFSCNQPKTKRGRMCPNAQS